jgi:hypothetical protein
MNIVHGVSEKLLEFIDKNQYEAGVIKNSKHLKENLNLYDVFSHVIDNNFIKNKKVFSCDVNRFAKWFNLDKSLFEFVDKFHAKGLDPILAGGKIVDLMLGKKFEADDNDIDFFFLSEKSRREMEDYLLGQRPYESDFDFPMLRKAQECTRTVDFNHITEFNYEGFKLQLIKKEYSFIEEILENFDIRACAFAYFHGTIYWVKGALKDIKEKKINFLTVRKESYTSYIRILKYNKKGFDVSAGNMLISCIQMLQFLIEGRGANKEKLFTDAGFFPDREELANMSYEEMLRDAPQDAVEINATIPRAIIAPTFLNELEAQFEQQTNLVFPPMHRIQPRNLDAIPINDNTTLAELNAAIDARHLYEPPF